MNQIRNGAHVMAGVIVSFVVTAQQGGVVVPPRCGNQDTLFGSTKLSLKTTADDVRRVITEDLDNDGDSDVLAASCGDGTVSWFDNEGGSPVAFTEIQVTTTDDCPTAVLTADIDGDDITDVLVGSSNGLAFYKFNNEFPFEFDRNVITTDDSILEQLVDFDLDGDPDIIFRRWETSEIGWFENVGRLANSTNFTFVEHLVDHNQVNPAAVRAADVDNDGDLDLIATSRTDDRAVWHENLGDGIFRGRAIGTLRDGPASVEGVDFDGDLDIDCVMFATGENTIYFYENDGGSPPRWTEHPIISSSRDLRNLVITDVDNDGRLDFVTTDEVFYRSGSYYYADLSIVWYENTGALNFLRHDIDFIQINNGNWGSSAADINQFGFVAVGDLDGDGIIDVAATFRLNSLVRWYPSQCIPFTGPTVVPTTSPSGVPTVVPFPVPTTVEPTPLPTATKSPSTETPEPSVIPTPAPTNLPNCQDSAVDDTLGFCQTLAQACIAFDTFCDNFHADYTVRR